MVSERSAVVLANQLAVHDAHPDVRLHLFAPCEPHLDAIGTRVTDVLGIAGRRHHVHERQHAVLREAERDAAARRLVHDDLVACRRGGGRRRGTSARTLAPAPAPAARGTAAVTAVRAIRAPEPDE